MKQYLLVGTMLSGLVVSGCGYGANSSPVSNSAATPASATPKIGFTVLGRPQKIADLMKTRGEQDNAAPKLTVIQPKADSTVTSSTVKVKLALAGDLKGYKPMMNEETHTGNHIHVILDNQPYEAYYNLDQEFELRNVSDGEHTLRVFPSRPWHESYKNDGAFQMVKFRVSNGGAAANRPATTNSGAPMSDAAKPTPEGKEMKESTAGAVDPAKPLLTFSRPKGEYKGEDASAIMLDFWLANAKLTGDGGDLTVRLTVNGGEPRLLQKWEPVWISGLADGKNTFKLELVDKGGNPVENGGYNTTTREIMLAR